MNKKDIIENKLIFETIFNNSAYGIIVTEPESGKIILANSEFYNMSGYSQEEIIGNTLSLGLWDNLEQRKEIIHELYETGKSIKHEFTFNCKNKTIYGIFSASVIVIENESYIISSVYDITKQVENDKKIKKNNEFINSIIKAIPDEMIIINRNKEITWSNFDYLKNKNICNVFHGSENCRVNKGLICPIEEVFNTGKTIEFEIEENNKWYFHICTPCNSNGHINTVLEMRRDITDRKRLMELDGLREIINKLNYSQLSLQNTIKELVNNEQPKI